MHPIDTSPTLYHAATTESTTTLCPRRWHVALVTFLTLLAATAGCAFVERHLGEVCKTRAYVRTDFESYINQRFTSGEQVRMAVIPFVSQANLAAYSNELPGIGNNMAWGVQRELLDSGVFPIVELLNRQDWPGKKEEFFAGNFGAITHARNAQYDLVLLGFIEPIARLDTWIVHTKVIDLQGGVTLWYGTTTVVTQRAEIQEVGTMLGGSKRRPDLLYTTPLLDEATRCIAADILKDRSQDEG